MNASRLQSHSKLVLVLLLTCFFANGASSQNADSPTDNLSSDLSVEQAVLADRYERLEMIASRLAELSAATDPRRARRLREAIARSRELDLNARFEGIVKLLEEEQLAAAVSDQNVIKKELSRLLELLLKDTRGREMKSEQRRVREYLKQIGRLIRWQQGIRARTDSDESAERLAENQESISDETNDLGKKIEEVEGVGQKEESQDSQNANSASNGEQTKDDSNPDEQENNDSSSESPPASGEGEKPSENSSPPSEGSKPSENPGAPSKGSGSAAQSSPSGEQSQSQQPMQKASEKLKQAAQKMEQAQESLEQAKRDGAIEKQEQALADLEEARSELEEVLRQLREEELERTLTTLLARFRKMLEVQVEIYDGTLLIDEVALVERDHREEIEAARLSRRESLLVREIDKVLLLLREEGSSVAFPETAEQIRSDMLQVTDRLKDIKVGTLTQQIELDIIETIEEVIAALDKAIDDLKENKEQSPPPGSPQGPSESPLVDKIAELKLIRSLQLRINRRTERYDTLLVEEPDQAEDIYSALKALSVRQSRVFKATKDLATGRND